MGIEVGTDGKVYAGSHYNGCLYQYTQGSDKIVNLGRLGSETHVFPVVVGPEGKIYAGTYPNGSVYEYDLSTNQIRLLDRMQAEEKYVRLLTYNPDLNVLYAGVGGAKAYLYRIDSNTGAKEGLLSKYIPQDPSNSSMTTSLGYALGKLFIRVNKPDQFIIVDTATDTVEYYDPNSRISMGQNTLLVKPGDDPAIYINASISSRSIRKRWNSLRSIKMSALI